jgi:hypothetical protein
MIFGGRYKLWCSYLCSFLELPVTSSLMGPNIFFSTLFSNTRSLYSSLNVRDQVSQPYKAGGTVVVLYILIFTFLDSRREDSELQERFTSASFDVSYMLVRQTLQNIHTGLKARDLNVLRRAIHMLWKCSTRPVVQGTVIRRVHFPRSWIFSTLRLYFS